MNEKKMKLVRAVFTGQNGSCGFETGKVYELGVREENNLIHIESGNLKCEYSTIITFLSNWDLNINSIENKEKEVKRIFDSAMNGNKPYFLLTSEDNSSNLIMNGSSKDLASLFLSCIKNHSGFENIVTTSVLDFFIEK